MWRRNPVLVVGIAVVAFLMVVGVLALLGLGTDDMTEVQRQFGVAKEQGQFVLYQSAGGGIGEASIAYGDGTGADGIGPVLWTASYRGVGRAPSRLVLFHGAPGYRTTKRDLKGSRLPPIVVDTLNDGRGNAVNVQMLPIPAALAEGSVRTGAGSTRPLSQWLRLQPDCSPPQ